VVGGWRRNERDSFQSKTGIQYGIIKESHLNDLVEFFHDGEEHVGYFDMECGCLLICADTLSDGYVCVHDLEEEFVDDIDGKKYITAKLIGNRFDNADLLYKGEE